MQQVQLKKRKIAYQWLPQPGKQVLVLTHALGMNQQAWQALISCLKQEYSVLTWDLPGHGASEAIGANEIVTPQSLVQELIDLISFLEIERFTYVGTSIGGVIGLAMLQTQLGLLQGMVLTNTGAVIGSATAWNERCENILQHTLSGMAASIVPRWFSSTSVENSKEPLLQRWEQALSETDTLSYIKLCNMLAVTDLRQIRRARVPVALLVGSEDVATPPELMQALSQQLNTKAPVVLRQVGHIPSVEAPESLAKLILSL